MHICLLNSFFHEEIGGIEKHVYSLSKGLSDAGFDVSIITSDLNQYTGEKWIVKSGFLNEKISVLRLPVLFKILNNPITPALPIKILSKKQFDVIHCHDQYYFGSLISAYLKKIYGKPLVLTIHTSKIKYSHSISNMIRSLYDRSFSRYILKSSDSVIVLSEAIRKQILSKAISPSKIKCIPNGIFFNNFLRNKNANSKEKSTQETVLLFVGRLVERKGVHVLIEAMKFLSKRLSCRLSIIGDGPQRKKLEKLSKTHGISSIISFQGYVSHKRLIDAYENADIFILPSISGEVQPFVLLEAIDFEKPFVATKIGGIPDLKKEGIFGYYIEPNNPTAIADAVLDFAWEREDVESKGITNKKIAKQKFSVEKMVKDTIKVYEGLV